MSSSTGGHFAAIVQATLGLLVLGALARADEITLRSGATLHGHVTEGPLPNHARGVEVETASGSRIVLSRSAPWVRSPHDRSAGAAKGRPSTSGKEGGTASLKATAPSGVVGSAKIGAFYAGDVNYLASWSPLAAVTLGELVIEGWQFANLVFLNRNGKGRLLTG